MVFMTRADDRSRKTERLGTVLRRVLPGIVATQRIESGRTPVDCDKSGVLVGNSARPAGNPTAVEPGNTRGEDPIADAGRSQGRASGRLEKGPTYSGQGGDAGEGIAGETNIVQLWPRPRGQAAGARCRAWGSAEAPAVRHVALSDENSEPLNISTARGSAYQRSQSGYVRRSICTCRACRTVVWSRCPNILPI